MDITKLGTDRVSSDRVVTSDAAKTQKSQASKSTERVDKDSVAQTSNTAKSSAASNVKWSATAKLADEALAIAKASPDVRADKVASIKAQIANGTYKTDSKAIADKMVETSLEDDLLARNG